MPAASRIKVKICGMRDAANIRAVAALHPDYMGFIFYPGSKRFVGKGFNLPNDFPDRIKRVGVFVNERTPAILQLAEQHSLDFIQLHGGETPEQCEELRQKRMKIIKVFSIEDKFDFNKTKNFKNTVDYLLFDSAGPGYGGTGKTFDWRGLRNYDQEIPFFLSGGLTPGNIQEVDKLRGMNIHALDLNSGVESEPGIKDVSLIEELQHRRLNSFWLQS